MASGSAAESRGALGYQGAVAGWLLHIWGSDPSCLRDRLVWHEGGDGHCLARFAVVAALCVHVALLLVAQVMLFMVLCVSHGCTDNRGTLGSSGACSKALSVDMR